MSFESSWANLASGTVRNHYNARTVEEKFGGQVTTSGKDKQLSWTFSYDDLPATSEGALDVDIPADAFIKSSHLHVIEGFVGGTSYNIGLYEADGTVIDADGIDAAVLTAALTEDAWIVNDGALVGASIGAAAGKLVVAATGTFTAGKAELIVEYYDSQS